MLVSEMIQLLNSFDENKEVYLEDAYLNMTSEFAHENIAIDAEGDVLIKVR